MASCGVTNLKRGIVGAISNGSDHGLHTLPKTDSIITVLPVTVVTTDRKKERETRPIACHVAASNTCKYSSFSNSGGQTHGQTEIRLPST